jgi:hypothetical protein
VEDLEATWNALFEQLQPAPSVRRFVVSQGEPLPPEYFDYKRQRPDGLVIIRRIVRVPNGRNARATVTAGGTGRPS